MSETGFKIYLPGYIMLMMSVATNFDIFSRSVNHSALVTSGLLKQVA